MKHLLTIIFFFFILNNSAAQEVACGYTSDEVICQDFIQDALLDYPWESNCGNFGCSYTIRVGKYLGNDVIIMREECTVGIEFAYYWRVYTCAGILLEECSFGLTGSCDNDPTVYDNVTELEIIYDCSEQELPTNCECVLGSIACNDMVNVFMATATNSVSVFNVLENENANCSFSFSATQTIEQLFFDCNDIGSQSYQVFDLTTGNSCYGTLNIIDSGGCEDSFVCPSDPDTILCQTWLSNIVNSSTCNFSNPQSYNYFKVYTVPYQGETSILFYKEQFIISDGANEFTLYSCAGDTLYECSQGFAGDCNDLNADPIFGPIINDTILIYDCRVDQLDCPDKPFITTWKTVNPGTSCSSCITIPTYPGETYNYDVDWDNDGTYDEFGISGNAIHDYGVDGTFTISIKGEFPRIYFNGGGDKEKIINIDQWGDIGWTSMSYAFAGCFNLNSDAIDIPNLNNVTSLGDMFSSAHLFNGNLSQWNVGNVIDMSGMFQLAFAFESDLSQWDVSKVTDMSIMFSAAYNFNSDLSNWNVSNVTYMTGMFKNTEAFNADLSMWNVNQVIYLSSMFSNALVFNQNLGNWDISATTDNNSMLNNSGLSCENYTSTLIGWANNGNTPNSLTLGAQGMQYDQSAVTARNQLISKGWAFDGDLEGSCGITTDCSSTTDSILCYDWLNQIISNTSFCIDPGSSAITYKVYSTEYNGAPAILVDDNINCINPTIFGAGFTLYACDGTQIESCSYQGFETCSNPPTDNPIIGPAYDIATLIYDSEVDVLPVCDTQRPFITTWKTDNPGSSCSSCVTIPTTGSGYNYDVDWENDGVFDEFGLNGDASHTYGSAGTYEIAIRGEFPRIYFRNDGDKGKIIEIIQWGDIEWTSMESAFYGCSNLQSNTVDVPDLNNVTDLSKMFKGAIVFNQDISTWDISGITNLNAMFDFAAMFNQDLSTWSVDNVTDMGSLFRDTDNFNHDLSTWNVSNVTDMNGMFERTGNFNQDLSSWDVSNVTNMFDMFKNAISFNQSLATWDLNSISECNGMLDNAGFDCDNYSATLIGWATNSNTSNNLTLGADGMEYGAGAISARNTLVAKGWTFDGDSQGNCLNEQQPFITTWKTDNDGSSCSSCITIPTFSGEIYSYDVDWENDGTFDEFGLTNDATHNYSSAGTYSVAIRGTFPRIYFNNNGDRQKIINIDQWGEIEWSSMESAFLGCENLNSNASDSPDLSSVTNMLNMFRGALSFNHTLDNWDVSNVTRMSFMFAWASSFDQPLNNWNVSNVTAMNNMFASATLFNQPLNNWDVGNVENMGLLFSNAESFNQSIENWNVQNVGDMGFMLRGATAFNQNLASLDLTSITQLNNMLDNSGVDCENYSSTLTGWAANSSTPNGLTLGANGLEYDISATTARDELINNLGWTINGDSQGDCLNNERPFITTWKTDNLGTSCSSCITIPTFSGETYNYDVDWDNDGTYDKFGITGEETHDFLASGTYTIAIRGEFPRIYFNDNGDKEKILNIDQWGDIEWSNMNRAFQGCININSDAIDSPDLSAVTDLSYMFYEAIQFNGDISNWDVSNINDMSSMFTFASSFNQPIGSWDVSNVNDMSSMFSLASLFNQSINDWNVSNVTDMNGMFGAAVSFNQPLNLWDVSNVTNMLSMFREAENFNQNINDWQVGQVTNMTIMFGDAITFNQPLNNWDVSKVTGMNNMFNNALVFDQSIQNWNVNEVTDMAYMFRDASSFNQPIDSWNISKVTRLNSTFLNAFSFNQNLGAWDLNSVLEFENMLDFSGIDCENYTSTLQGWAVNVNTPSGRELGAQNIEYGNETQNARDSLISILGWTINGDVDLGKDCSECGPESCLLNNPPTWTDTQSIPDVTISCIDDIPLLLFLTYSNGQTGDCQIEGELVPVRDESNFDGCSGTYVDTWSYTTSCGVEIESYSRTITVSPQGSLAFDVTPEPSITISCDDIDLYDISLDYMLDQGNNCIPTGSVDPVVTNNYDACGGTVTFTWTVNEPCYGSIEFIQTADILPNDDYQYTNLPKDIFVECVDLPFVPEILTVSNGIEGKCAASEQIIAVSNPDSQDCPGTITNTWVYINPCTNEQLIHVQKITLVDCAPPALEEDYLEIRANNIYNINLFDNDVLPDSFSSRVIEFENEDLFTSSRLDQDGYFEFEIRESFFDTLRVPYEICNLECDICTTAFLKIVDDALKDIFLSDIITPDGDGMNDALMFNFESEISSAQLFIYNRWGSKIYEKLDYTNDWDASGLPGGIYYYVLKVGRAEVKKTLTVIK